MKEKMKRLIENLVNRLDSLETENQELKNRLDCIESSLPKEEFFKACAIGHEQLWSVVFNDILKQDVPSGENLENLI